jgi:hypothetical protein
VHSVIQKIIGLCLESHASAKLDIALKEPNLMQSA